MRDRDDSRAGPDDRGLLRGLVNLVFVVAVLCLLAVGSALVAPAFPVDVGPQQTPSSDPPPAGERNPAVTDPGDPNESHYETNVEVIASSTVEDFVHAEVNERRAERGLEELPWDGTIASVSRAHSADMDRRGYFDHTNPDGEGPHDRFRDVADYCHGYGENIARNAVDQRITRPGTDGSEWVEYRTAEGIATGLVDQWMNSTPHRKAILEENVDDGWDRTGVGVYVAEDGAVYATQNFCHEW